MSYGLGTLALGRPREPAHSLHSTHPDAYTPRPGDGLLAHAASLHGRWLSRTLDGAHTLDLTALTLAQSSSSSSSPADGPSARIAFPAALVGPPTVRPSRSSLVVVGLTSPGLLYRIVLPDDPHEWHAVLDRDSDDWATEHAVRALAADGGAAVSTLERVDDDCLLLGLKSGVLLKLEWESSSETWLETTLKPSSYLSSLSSLIPFSSSSSSSLNPHTIHSLASYLPPDAGSAQAFSLSCDRRLRVWNLLTGACVKTFDLPGSGELLPLSGVEGGWIKHVGASYEAGSEVVKRGSEAVSRKFDDYLAVYQPGTFLLYGIRPSQRAGSPPDLVPHVAVPAPTGTLNAALRTFDVVPTGSQGDVQLWSVWDHHGRSSIHHTTIRLPSAAKDVSPRWQEATNLPEPAFTASFFTDLFHADPDPSADTLAELFLSHLFYPGRFAYSSLLTALEAYISTLLSSLPPSNHPGSLSSSYPSFPVRIGATVGSHLSAETDVATGGVKEREYLEALLAEWLGFLARVEGAERSARWELTSVRLDVGGRGDVEWACVRRDGLVVPFRRVGEADDQLALVVAASSSVASQGGDVDTLLKLGQTIADSLPFANVRSLRADLTAYAAGSSTFGCVEDALLDLWESMTDGLLGHDVLEVVDALVESGQGANVVAQAERLLDLVGSNNTAASREVEGDEYASHLTPLGAALLSQTLLHSLESRERFTLYLLLAQAALLAQTHEEDPSFVPLARSLSRTVDVWREVTSWAWVATEGIDVSLLSSSTTATGSEWVERFGGLKVAGGVGASRATSSSAANHAALLPPPSILSTLLLAQPVHLSSLSSAAAVVLNTTSFANPADRTPALKLVADVLAIGQPARAYALAQRWDESEGMGYEKGRAGLALGSAEESERYFERVAGAFDLPSTSSPLRVVLPAKVVDAWSLAEYYRHVSLLYAPQTHDASIIKFCNLAIAAAALDSPPTAASDGGMDVDENKENTGVKGAKTKDLWSRLFAATVSLGRYEDAYMVLISNPHKDTINDAVSHLITNMCHANQVARLVQFSFVGLQDVVERTLAFKARHSDPMAFPSYPMVLYSWHIHRGDYRSAALAIYQQARRFGDAHGPFAEISSRRAKSYLLAINALSLVDKKHAWLALTVAVDPTSKRRKRQKTTSHIPEEVFSMAAQSKDVEIVDLDDIRREYNLVLSTLTLAEKFPNSFHSNILLAEDAVNLFLQAGMVDTAVSTAKKLDVDLESVVPI